MVHFSILTVRAICVFSLNKVLGVFLSPYFAASGHFSVQASPAASSLCDRSLQVCRDFYAKGFPLQNKCCFSAKRELQPLGFSDSFKREVCPAAWAYEELLWKEKGAY